MEKTIINKEKGYLWPFDKLCYECRKNIHLENKEDIHKLRNGETGEVKYYCICKCGEIHFIHADQIPEEIRNSL